LEILETRLVMSVKAILAGDTYSFDGTGNNVAHSSWGAAGNDLLRKAPAQYGDGISTPGGANRPSAREISNVIDAQGNQDILSSGGLSAMAYAWGQFVDHDLDLTPTGNDPLNIAVPTGDPWFDPNSTGTQVIPTTRSITDPTTGTSTSNPLQQVTVVTSWMDGSMIYGSNATTAAALRTFEGGHLKVGTNDLLPLNNSQNFPNGTLPMSNDAGIVPDDQLFAAGDVRANENIELTAMQTMFMREHNYWADKLAKEHPKWDDQQLYTVARAIVIGEIQSITYNEWLPAILGPNALTPYTGYNPNANPGIANEFSTAAFRFGHSMLGDEVGFLNNDGSSVTPEMPLSEVFSDPTILEQYGISPSIKYLATDPSSEIDTKVVDSLRNMLFGPPGSGGLDLASLNIERGRDHGLADYNSIRVAYGLPAVTSFSQITSNVQLQQELQQMYGSVNNIDAWVGMLAEDHAPGANVGPTAQAVIADQFERIRDGDRFWYQREFSGQLLNQIQHTTLADIMARDAGVTNTQSNVFYFKASVSGTVWAPGPQHGPPPTHGAAARLPFGMGPMPGQVEHGLADQTVELFDSTGTLVATTTSDQQGHYSFDVLDGLAAGKYDIELMSPNGTVVSTDHANITKGGVFIKGLDFYTQPAQHKGPNA
jgi:hypothetical protein